MFWNLGSSCALLGCLSVRRAWQLGCKRFITNRGDIVSAGLRDDVISNGEETFATQLPSSANRQTTKAVLNTGDLITFRKNGIIDAADDVVGVYHDTCGNCEAVLLPSCEDNVKEKFLKVENVVRFCRFKSPTLCAVGSVVSSNVFTHTDMGTTTKHTTTTANLKLAEPDDPLNPALTMSPQLMMKRLPSNCQARRTDQQPNNAPELPTFHHNIGCIHDDANY
ncbi:hypothetical protein T265_03396 [Opisthorchis viverrini]|uniref:Uncharacterized protein n=1 Tax=Opisthorchis viverrini TaxID=6198 RepID=A0A075A3L1_OPIVI|nr:hypothetical protein T265_03396 [Opisthorchis viverrini]KER30135.1 hypothetical protein T265_03396 [Opisthorchis viverrini]